MRSELKYVEIMWAEQKPDCYDGPDCDQLRPEFELTGDDKGGAETADHVHLLPRMFPPGTRLVVSVPICPNCEDQSDLYLDGHSGKMDKCQCGFDWENWAVGQYS